MVIIFKLPCEHLPQPFFQLPILRQAARYEGVDHGRPQFSNGGTIMPGSDRNPFPTVMPP